MSSSMYGHYVTTTIQEFVGDNTGYSRYLDNHIGMDIENIATLDQNARKLEDGQYAFHSGGGKETGADGAGSTDDSRRLGLTSLESHDTWAGSNWARGKAGVNFEFRSAYEGHDGSFFNVSDIVQLDYCSPTGFSRLDVDDVTYCPEPEQKPSLAR